MLRRQEIETLPLAPTAALGEVKRDHLFPSRCRGRRRRARRRLGPSWPLPAEAGEEGGQQESPPRSLRSYRHRPAGARYEAIPPYPELLLSYLPFLSPRRAELKQRGTPIKAGFRPSFLPVNWEFIFTRRCSGFRGFSRTFSASHVCSNSMKQLFLLVTCQQHFWSVSLSWRSWTSPGMS